MVVVPYFIYNREFDKGKSTFEQDYKVMYN